MIQNNLKIFSGRSNPLLAKQIAQFLDRDLGAISIHTFSDGELWIKYEENIRGHDVFIVQSTNGPSENIIELTLMVDAAVRASADTVTVVIPYFGYARQDRKVVPRTAISAKLVSNLITNAGANRILSVDLHAGQIQGFFDIPVDNLFATPIFARHVKKKMKLNNLICVSPDAVSYTHLTLPTNREV